MPMLRLIATRKLMMGEGMGMMSMTTMSTTSTGRNSSVFVRGIPIGQVESVGSQEVELYQSIAIRPFVDFLELDIVHVIVR